MENPGYRGARGALGRPGRHWFRATFCPTGAGYSSAGSAAVCPAAVLYAHASVSHGGILDITQRLALLDWAGRTGTWIIEDDYDSEFHFVGKPVAALQGLFEKTPVLYVGSFSKTLFAGIASGVPGCP